jgi:hypothetical protein
MSAGTARRASAFPTVSVLATTAVLATVPFLLGWRGEDFPAQIYRIDLVRKAGVTLWNNGWYGGHATLSYSVLFPLVGSVVGVYPLALGSVLLATLSVEQLLRPRVRPRYATLTSLLFGFGMISNVVVGRLTFLLGFAFGAAALWALDRNRRVLAMLLGLACGLSSPVAGVFAATAAVAVVLASRRRRDGTLLALCVVAAPALVMLLMPGTGDFPFQVVFLAPTLAASVGVVLLSSSKPVRVASLLYTLLVLGMFVVPNAMGANASRLAMYATFPVLVAGSKLRPWMVLAVIAPILLVWQWIPAAVTLSRLDPSAEAAYFAPVIDYAKEQLPLGARIEIPFTLNHWEAAYVANEVPLARGWERQRDRVNNPLFYDAHKPLDGATYERWLHDNAIALVALPDVELDFSATAEGALLRTDPAFLQRVWANEHWVIWKVRDPTPVVEGPASLASFDTASVTVEFASPGTATVRVRYSNLWYAPGDACVDETTDGWIALTSRTPGLVELHTRVGGGHDRCTSPGTP